MPVYIIAVVKCGINKHVNFSLGNQEMRINRIILNDLHSVKCSNPALFCYFDCLKLNFMPAECG